MLPTGKNPLRTRILVLEEHPLLRHGIIDYIDSQPDIIVCGETHNISDARNKIAEYKPQLLLTALRLGTGDSLEFVKALKAEQPGLLILVLFRLRGSNLCRAHPARGRRRLRDEKAPKATCDELKRLFAICDSSGGMSQ
jgi:DNA-binding NarL/FixJ family response regulator